MKRARQHVLAYAMTRVLDSRMVIRKMREILRKLLMLSWLLLPMAAFATPADEFYQRMYKRGMTHFAAAEYEPAFTELRTSAFGFVEQVEKFETIQVYAAIAAHRIGHDTDARESLMRITAAEKIEPHFLSVTLPEEIRVEVDKVAAVLLTHQEASLLGVTQAMQDAAAAEKHAVVVPTPSKQPNVAETAPRDSRAVDNAPPAADAKPAPQPVTPEPAKENPPVTRSSRGSAESRLADAQRAIDKGDVVRAQSIYDALLSAPSLDHKTALHLAEALYRARDFAKAARAFQRAGTVGAGEERYHFYYAVTLYETGRFNDAKRELAAAIPYIAMTPDVAGYRAKIEGASD